MVAGRGTHPERGDVGRRLDGKSPEAALSEISRRDENIAAETAAGHRNL